MTQIQKNAGLDLERTALWAALPRRSQVLYLLAIGYNQTTAALTLGISKQRVSFLINHAI